MNEVFSNRVQPIHNRSSVSPTNTQARTTTQSQVQVQVPRGLRNQIEIDSPIEPKRQLGNLSQFQIIKIVGNGSFGKVYQVMHKATKKIFAMKQLSKSKLISKRQIKYAVSECNILKQVSSPYIINLYKSFQTPQYLYLIMEYCSGDLALHLSRLGVFKEEVTRLIIRELSLAIEHLHQLDILYRDLKPENILLGAEGHIKLVDFGLSKQVDLGGKAKSFCGSPAYLAPEMLTGKGATKATDVYGLGTVMFELLTGDPPYFHEDIDCLYKNIREGQLKIPTHLSVDAKSLLLSLLHKEPSKRLGCKNVNSIDWKELRSAAWFGDTFSRLDERIKLQNNDETVDWVSDDDSSDQEYQEQALDNDYDERNWKLNRVIDWSFDKI